MAEAVSQWDDFHPSQLFNEQNIPAPGEALLVIHPGQDIIISRSAVAPFILTDQQTGRLVYRGPAFVAPPEVVWPRSEEETFDLLASGLAAVRSKQLGDEERAALRSKFTFVRCASLETKDVVAAVQAAGQKQFIFLPWATSYKQPTSAPTDGQPKVRLHEDLWVPDTAALARLLIEVVEKTSSYVFMTTPVSAPTTEASNQILLGVEGLTLSGLQDGGQDDLMQRLACWAALAAAGRGNEALAQVAQANLPDGQAKQARMQILATSGDHVGAAALIRELLQVMSVSGGAAVQWAGFSLKGDDPETAKRLLEASLEALHDERHLQEALQIATQIRDANLVEVAWNRLHGINPQSPTLELDCELRLLQICRRATKPQTAQAISRVGFSAHHHWLAQQLGATSKLDYVQLLANVGAQWPEHRELALMCFATHAKEVGASVDAWLLATELIPESRFSAAATRLVLAVMSQMLLADVVDPEDAEVYKLPVAAVISHLANHPADAPVRASLLNTLDVDRAGRIGYAILISVTLDFTSSAPIPLPEPPKVPEAPENEFKSFLGRLDGWLGEAPLLDPRRPLPAEVVGPEAAALGRLLKESLEHKMEEKTGVEELKGLEFQAHLLPAIARHVPDTTDDISGLRALASRYSVAGDNQRARDLAELILEVAGDSPARRRLAWGAYADIYLRTGNRTDALVGLNCAAATQAALPTSELAYEVYTLFRALRDIGFAQEAASVLETYKRLQDSLGMSDMTRHRLDVIELTFKLKTASRKDVDSLEAILAQAHELLEQAFAFSDELFASAFLFAQVCAIVELAGGDVPQESKTLKHRALAQFAPETATYLRALSTAKPEAADLVKLHENAGRFRYAGDAPTDATALAIAAHRLLRPSNPELPVQDAFLACEVLAERGVRVASPAPALTQTWPLQYASSLASTEKLSVLMLAFDDEGELVAASADASESKVVRPAAKPESAKTRLRTWAETYPYKYGHITPGEKRFVERTQRLEVQTDAEFYSSMRPIDVPLAEGERLLVVTEPDLAQLTYNLVLKGKEFAGYSTAIAMVPSLTWLAATRQLPSGGDGRRLAWISEGAATSSFDAMRAVNLLTEGPMAKHGISLNSNAELPSDFNGAQMAIVTAHGQLASDDKFIHRIVDEGTLKVSPLELANALADVELVILFVCSGGRVDRHPNVSTTVGLPSMLLNRGCRTVIASPWPLESLVPGWWLPAFLDAWASGKTALDACHAANRHVNDLHAYQPQRSLAMMVYGDALLKSSPGVV